ncbi:transcriptional regulator [compost metagenome]
MRKAPPKPTPEWVKMVIGARIRELRHARELTQEALAERADLHTNYVSSVERGERNVGVCNLASLAHALDVPASALMQPLDARRDSSK